MKNFKKTFYTVLKEQEVAPNPDPTQLPQVQPDQMTQNPSLQASLDSTAASGDVGSVALRKMPEWKQQISQIQQLTTKMLDEIQPTAGQPGAASIWKSLNISLTKIATETGTMLGKLEGLTRTVPVSQKAASAQR